MRALSIAALFALSLPLAAQAETNRLLLLAPSDALNIAEISMTGDGNVLRIGQAAPEGGSVPNRIAVSISGDRNGGTTSSTLDLAPLIADLPWGSLTQSGQRNTMAFEVTGADNLFAAAQSGTGNALSATIAGTGNLSAVSQTGTGNIASFSQSGSGNLVSITQRSW